MARRNREGTALGPLEIEVGHADGVERLDPVGAIVLVAGGGLDGLRPVAGARSVISGAPALTYRSDDLAIALTADELAGLVGCELTPAEARLLEARYGEAFEWHDDFYDQASWEALQPKGLRAPARGRGRR